MVIRLGASADEVATQDELDALAADIAANYVPTARSVSTAAPLTGGGDLTENRTLGVSTGTTSGTVATGDHTHSGYVPTSQRGLIGGAASSSGTGAWTPNAATASEHRRTATGDTTVAVPSGGVDTQLLRLWFLASGAQRTVTFDAAYEVTQPVPGRVFVIPSGTWGEVLAVNRGGTWVLLAAYPQSIAIDAASITTGVLSAARVPLVTSPPVTITYASTVTPNAALGSNFRCSMTGAMTVNVPSGGTDGQRLLFELTASAAERAVTFAAGYELGANVTSRTVTIPSGLTGYVGVVNRGGTYRMLAVDDGA